MFIRRTQTRSKASGQSYVTHRLVQSERIGARVKQTTLLNLGAHFHLPQAQWAALAQRVEQLLHGATALLDSTLCEAGQALAQRLAARLIASHATDARHSDAPGTPQVDHYQCVDLDSLELLRPRSVGVENAALTMMSACALQDKLAELGFNRPQIASAVGNIVGRMAHPSSELATHAWLRQRSALDELLEFDFEAMDLNRLYRASDLLYKHRDALQDHLFVRAQALLGFGQTITLYDLTNTYFEGVAAGIDKARRGRSKERRSDCPLVTLAMVLDGSGFVRCTRVFAGNVSESSTLSQMLQDLRAASGVTVVMDAGIATEANLKWLREHGYHYVVVSRLRERQFDPSQASELCSAGGVTIKLQRVIDAEGHVLLYCHSPAREQKDRAIDVAKANGFERVLNQLQISLNKPRASRASRDAGLIMQRIGRAKERYARAAQHYDVKLTEDDAGRVQAITWSKKIKSGSAATHPGVYCLRSTLVDLDNATLWRTYIMLTELESVFRSLKTDLGLRPVFHQIERRVEGHLFISVLAYHFVHLMRQQLKAHGIDESWQTLRQTLSTQQRVTITLQRKDGRTVHIRKATRPEPEQHTINTILSLPSNPGGTQRTLV